MEETRNIFYQFVFNNKLRWLRHLLFWSAVYLNEIVFAVFNPQPLQAGLYSKLISDAIVNGSVLAFNLYFLIPRFLLKKKYTQYGIYTFSLILLTAYYAWWVYTFDSENGLKFVPFYIFQISMNSVVTGSAIGIKMFKMLYLHQNRIKRLQKEKLQTELNYLKNQVNPHFLFNTLNNIHVLHRTNHPDTGEIILKLSDLLRYQIYDCAKEKVSMEKEIEYIQNYFKLVEIRSVNLNIELDIQTHCSPKAVIIDPLLFTPFIENATKYCRKNKSDYYIKLEMQIHPESIWMNLSNTKLGQTPAHLKGGFGLKNVKRRLDLIFKNNYTLNLEDTEELYTVELKINL